jgi:hypothetical protein
MALVALGAGTARAQKVVAFKSPGAGMHFTEGLPIVVFLDLFDGAGSGFGSIETDPSGAMIGWPQGEVLFDGVRWKDNATGSETIAGPMMRDPNNNPSPVDFYRMEAVGLPPGIHQVVGRGLYRDRTSKETTPIPITVDPWPADKQQITLSGDTTMATLAWDNVAVKGNGGRLMVSGTLTIRNSLVTGLGQIMGSVSNVVIEDSIFEDTGSLNLTLSGTATVSRNELRANNRLTFVANNPEVPNVITLSGSRNTNAKVFQGNRVGAGRVIFSNTSNWLIGGDTDELGNILIGPRCTLNFTGSSDLIVRGNFSRHNYRGGWSQGFNFYHDRATNILAEHNFIWGGSWPVQGITGELRYNVIYGYGHHWIRTVGAGTSIHHNLFVPESPGQLGEGIWTYQGQTGIQIYNNSFDGGEDIGDFAGPMVRMTGGAQVSSLRNNLMTFSRNQGNGSAGMPRVTGDAGGYLYVDYNAFYSPKNNNKDNYAITVGMTAEGTDGFGGHDVSGAGEVGVIDGQLAASPYAGERIHPPEMVIDDEGVWQRTQKLSSILAAFRARYTPQGPVVNAGDPQDNDSQGRRADIGAIDRDGHDQDKLGKFGMPPSETVPPTVSLTAPAADATLSGEVTLSADAMDNPGGSGVVLVQFLVDGATVAQTAASPYRVSWNSAVVSNDNHVFTAKAWDAAGNFAASAPVTARVSGNSAPFPDGGTGGGGSSGGPGAGGGGTATGGCGFAAMPGAGVAGSVLLLALALAAGWRGRGRGWRGQR